MSVIAVDLGGTRIRAARMDAVLPGPVVRAISAATQGLDAVLDQIADLIHQVQGDGPIRAVGVSAPGPLDPSTGIVYDTPNMVGWPAKTPLADLLRDRLNIPVSLANDANAAAVGEWVAGAGVGVDDLVYYTVSTGVGGGIIVGGSLLTGASGLAGELGHVTVDPNGPLCGCGNYGCVEAFASGTAIAAAVQRRIVAGEHSILKGKFITAEVVAGAARSGDTLACNAMLQAGRMLGIGVVNTLHSLNPARVVLGGGVMRSADLLFPPILAEIDRRALPRFRRTPLVRATLGDDAGLIGVAHLTRCALRD